LKVVDSNKMTALKKVISNQWSVVSAGAVLGRPTAILITVLLITLTLTTENRAAERPNVIVIMADDLGYSDLGCYGGEIETPHIDRLAEEGVRFTGFRNTCRCAPSRASLLTGRYQHAVGVGRMTANDFQRPGYRGQLSLDAPTLAEILKPEGYGTGIVGKWHLTVTDKKSPQKPVFPLDRGFDFFHGTWWGAKDYFSPQFMMTNREHLPEGKDAYPKDYYLTKDLSEQAIEFVKARIGEEIPFFLYLAHYAPHAPIQAPADRIEKCLKRYRVGFQQLQKERFARQQTLGVLPEQTQLAGGMPSWKKLNQQQQMKWAKTMATYAAMIEIMDDGIGELIDVLKAKGEYENTLILFLSDNGSTAERKGGGQSFPMLSNTPYRGQKAQTWEGGTSSPLIVSWPARLSQHAGAIRHGRCHIIDILPTCLETTGIEFPDSFRGKAPAAPHGSSLLSAVGGAELPERPLFWEHGGSRAVYQDGWKLVADRRSSQWKLYNLRNDPTEQKSLNKEFPDRVDSLRELWQGWAEEYDVVPMPGRSGKKN
jgi:arylsulfatase A-like enzyme